MVASERWRILSSTAKQRQWRSSEKKPENFRKRDSADPKGCFKHGALGGTISPRGDGCSNTMLDRRKRERELLRADIPSKTEARFCAALSGLVRLMGESPAGYGGHLPDVRWASKSWGNNAIALSIGGPGIAIRLQNPFPLLNARILPNCSRIDCPP